MDRTWKNASDNELADVYLGYAKAFTPHTMNGAVGEWNAVIDEINTRSTAETVDAWVRQHTTQ